MQMQTATSGLICDAVEAFGCPLCFQLRVATRCSAARNMTEQLLDEVHIFVLLEQLCSHDVSPEVQVHDQAGPLADQVGNRVGQFLTRFMTARRVAREKIS